jgi:hypothetical protein
MVGVAKVGGLAAARGAAKAEAARAAVARVEAV